MSPAKAALKIERTTNTPLRSVQASQNPNALPTNQFGLPLRPVIATPPAKRENGFSFQPRLPVIVGEATCRGVMPVDGLISGLANGNGGGVNVKQRTRNGASLSMPELDGEIAFKDMVRVTGHIAGRIHSDKGTLIIDESAKVDARVEVGVALISGTVNGNVVARERVDVGPRAVINGNISTPVLTIKPGAIFHGECRMIMNGANNGQVNHSPAQSK